MPITTIFRINNYFPLVSFAVLALPLIVQDQKEGSVSLYFLVPSYAAWLLSPLLGHGEALERLILSAIVLLAGALLARLFPDRLGEADIVFMSGMAAVFPYWSFVVALGLGCVAGLAAFLWLARGGRKEAFSAPIPFLPSLYWGGLTIIIGGFLF